jgi:aminopeptidase C
MVWMDEHGVTFRWKDYRDKCKTRHKTMTLAPDEFMRRFLLRLLLQLQGFTCQPISDLP